MNLENTEKLLTTYPSLYRELRKWGFECGDGWFDLIWQVSTEIEPAAHLEGIPQKPRGFGFRKNTQAKIRHTASAVR